VTNARRDEGLYRSGLALAAAGKHEHALHALREYLLTAPRDGRALNDAGAILYALGRFDEAVEHLARARELLPPPAPQTLENLAEAYLAAGRPADTIRLWDDLRGAGVLEPGMVHRAAAALLERGDRPGAMEALLRCRQHWPDQAALGPILERLRALRARVAFFCGFDDLPAVQDLYEFVARRFPTRLADGDRPKETFELMQWCDIAWFEGCAGGLVQASRLPKVCRIAARLQAAEALGPAAAEVNWAHVDVLAAAGARPIGPRAGAAGAPGPGAVRCLGYGVNLDRWPFADRPRGAHLACLVHDAGSANLPLLLQCFHALHRADGRYKLFVAGLARDGGALDQYLACLRTELGLDGSAFFEPAPDDKPRWLADKHYVVSAAVDGSDLPGVLEAMATGLEPVVHAWPGSRELLDETHLFRTSEEFCRRVLHDPYEPRACRDFVAGRFALARMLERVNEVLCALEADPLKGDEPQDLADEAAWSALCAELQSRPGGTRAAPHDGRR